jgi:hypothetical protein
VIDSLCARALKLETQLTDVDAHLVAVGLGCARELLEQTQSEANAMALTGAILLAEAVIEQLNADEPPRAEDGDIFFRFRCWAPGKRFTALVASLVAARDRAVEQRENLLQPLARAAMSMAYREEVEELRVS